jgi:preprotein translocase subunit SecE
MRTSGWKAATDNKGKAMTKEATNAEKTGPLAFKRQVRQEMGRVTWPTRKETTVSTIMVFVMVFVSAICLFFMDQIIAYLIQLILG